MRWKELQALFHRAMDAQKRGRGRTAAKLFRSLIESGSADPKHLSYGGLAVATEEGDVKTGLAWCERAVELAFYDPQMYINLALLHERTGWKTQAAKVLRKGLRIDPQNRKLLGELNRMNPRQPNPIPMLSRNHPVNRYLGRLKAEHRAKHRARARAKTSPNYS
jgi:Tfp pilus assembly protein PilF